MHEARHDTIGYYINTHVIVIRKKKKRHVRWKEMCTCTVSPREMERTLGPERHQVIHSSIG